MTGSAPPGPGSGRGAPLLITAELPDDVLAWADGLRQLHYPPERNRLRAHVTLFHALPPSSEAEVRRLLVRLAVQIAPPARFGGIFDLGTGTAFDIYSPEMVALHAQIGEALHGLLTRQDDRKLRLHVTVQNKVTRQTAITTQAHLATMAVPGPFHFHGFGLYAWEAGLWRPIRKFPFRGGPFGSGR